MFYRFGITIGVNHMTLTHYTIHITLYDVALFAMSFVTLTFVLLLWFAQKAESKANRFLAAALLVATLWIVRLLLLGTGLTSPLTLHFSLAFGPLIFFYVLKLSQPQYQFRKIDLLHFSPLLFELFAQASGQLNLVLQLLAFISVAVYLLRCLKLIEDAYRQQSFTGTDRYRHELRWLYILLTGFSLLWMLWIPFTAADYFYYGQQLSKTVYYPIYLLLMPVMIWLAANAFLRSTNSVSTNGAAMLKPLLPDQLKQKGIWLKNRVKENRYYEDPELSLSTLAGRLGLNAHELSRIINTALQKSFNDFINEYRVQAVIRKMQDPAFNHITLLGIAFESGFNSKTTFNRIFKQITGTSPAEYKNQLKKERPYYNLGRYTGIATVISSSETAHPKWSQDKVNRYYMFKNYLKIAWRNLTRNKSYTAVNVVGLSVGIAVCMLIFIVIKYQTSFDGFHSKKDRTYRVLTEYHTETGNVYSGKDIPFPLPAGLKAAFPQIEQVAPIYASQNDVLLIPDNNGNTDKVFKEQRGLFYTEPSFFKMFDFPLLQGTYASLEDPGNVLLTKDIAQKYFGDWHAAMGKTIRLRAGGYMFSHSTDVVKVSGILASIPPNTDFQLKIIASYRSFFNDYVVRSPGWNVTSDFGCYILMPPNIDIGNLNGQLRAYSRKAVPADNKDSYIIQPLNEVHYDTQTGNYSNKTIGHQLLNVLWLIAAFILLIACVNFVNLSTAQAVNRAKEVGVRKVLGSNKVQLQMQFIVETFLIVAGAVMLAIVISLIALPYLNKLLELSVSFNILTSPEVILFLLLVTLIVTALAGFYPSIVLSRFNPVNALKSKVTANATEGVSLRRGLVVFQFVIAQVLIIGTLVIVKQMDYFMDRPLGFDKDAIVNVPFRVDSLRISRLDYLRDQLLSINGVQAVSYSSNTPIENANDNWSTLRFDHAAKETDFKAITKFADEGYVPVYKLKLIAGRNLRPSALTREFLVNEKLVKSLGLKKPEDILNKEISIWNGVIKCPVVGVLKDFNDRSFRHELAPLLIATNITMYTQADIKLKTTNMAATMQAVKQVFNKTFPDFVYEYRFLDEKIGSFYKQENQLARLYQIFAAIAIFLSCLGLYGLASFMAVQRIKEVGIRKVLGATTGNIVYLFSKEFIILITIAFAIAAPIAWYYMHQWLQAYVYRIDISWWLFVTGGFASILIALLTVSFQAVKAAIASPVKSLRSE